MTVDSVRGAGTARAGATDTTMLIWKTIKANPGITRSEIWAKVEHGIPDGYALRRWTAGRPHARVVANGLATTRARSYVLSDVLANMQKCGNIVKVSGCYSALRQPKYLGNPEAIDVDGSKAAEHLAVADALRVAEKAIGKPFNRDKRNGAIRTRELYDAVTVMVKALRAKGSSD